MKNESLKRFALYGICTVLAVGALWLVLKYLLGAIIPFAVAFMVSALIRPLAAWLHKKTKIHRVVWAVLLIFAILALLVWGIATAVVVLYDEAASFIKTTTETLDSPDNIVRQVIDYFANFDANIPIMDKITDAGGAELADKVYTAASDMLLNIATKAGNAITTWATSFVFSLPGVVFAVLIGVIATFYLTFDYAGAKSAVMRLVPAAVKSKLVIFKQKSFRALGGYVRAYLSIMSVTFIELLIGFSIMRMQYAILLALIITIVDVLPVLGVGTVLIPWFIISFIMGNTPLGIGLLVLYCVIYVVRQIIEPRLVGDFIGIHPFVALLSVYTGFILLGVGGMILGPIVAYLVKTLVNNGQEDVRPEKKKKSLFFGRKKKEKSGTSKYDDNLDSTDQQ